MKQYKGYYIDNVFFGSEKEIDEYIKNATIKKFKTLCGMFFKNPSMEISNACCELSEKLHKDFGFTYEEIEAFEIQAIA